MQVDSHLFLSTPLLHSNPSFFFFNDTATTEIYTLSLHDALPISARGSTSRRVDRGHLQCRRQHGDTRKGRDDLDRKSTRLNSSHLVISYAVFCLKKKNMKAAKPPKSR